MLTIRELFTNVYLRKPDTNRDNPELRDWLLAFAGLPVGPAAECKRSYVMFLAEFALNLMKLIAFVLPAAAGILLWERYVRPYFLDAWREAKHPQTSPDVKHMRIRQMTLATFPLLLSMLLFGISLVGASATASKDVMMASFEFTRDKGYPTLAWGSGMVSALFSIGLHAVFAIFCLPLFLLLGFTKFGTFLNEAWQESARRETLEKQYYAVPSLPPHTDAAVHQELGSDHTVSQQPGHYPPFMPPAPSEPTELTHFAPGPAYYPAQTPP